MVASVFYLPTKAIVWYSIVSCGNGAADGTVQEEGGTKAMQPHERILVALDVDDLDTVDRLVDDLSPYVGGYKIGMQLATSVGVPAAVKFVHDRGGRVFLDQKFKDIPNTVAGAATAAANLGVLIFNVHADGGSKMMLAARQALDKRAVDHVGLRRPFQLGVTVLTSMDGPALEEIGYHKGMTPEEQVRLLAVLAAKSGCDGVVASAREAAMIRQAICDESFIIVTPAIQPEWATWAQGMDQRRPTTHIEALNVGSTYMVIGRAILRAPKPVDAAKRIADELAQAA